MMVALEDEKNSNEAVIFIQKYLLMPTHRNSKEGQVLCFGY